MHFTLPFGARPTGARQARIERSPHFRNGAFQSPVPTTTMLPGTLLRTLRMQLMGREQRIPPHPLPIASPTRATFATPPASGLRVTWLGHATSLIEMDGQRFLLDPVWSERASPFTFAGPRRFHPPPLALSELPVLDAVVISHDHYDHLDVTAIRTLVRDPAQRGLVFIVPLGVGAHLEAWGVAADRIRELDWWEATALGHSTITATPARHVSGRALSDTMGRRNSTLWASFVLHGPVHTVFFSGDTGFFDGLREIGDRMGPFDLTLIKIGAYGPTWPHIHLNPEQAVEAHQLLRGRAFLPIHWATFNLALHAWDEPGERVLRAANAAGVQLLLPQPGEAIEPALAPSATPWWRP